MDTSRIIHKIIAGQEYCYDRVMDVVFSGQYSHGLIYDRTQTAVPVDLCVELTTYCNFTCRNCFSSSVAGTAGQHGDVGYLSERIAQVRDYILRVCLTGGEPLMHPGIREILALPERVMDCGFVISTNGSIRTDLDDLLINNRWLVAISLHGRAETHDRYTAGSSASTVIRRIGELAKRTFVHIYCVLHDALEDDDIRWLFRLRDDAGVSFLRFIAPRDFGRYTPLYRQTVVEAVLNRLDERSGFKTTASRTRFITVGGYERYTH